MGLKQTEVIEQRKKYGSNALTKMKKNSFFKLLFESFSDPIIKILLIALSIKIVFIFKSFDWFETLGILVAVFLASFISSLSEYGSEKAFIKLQEDSSKIKVKVIRDNKKQEVPIDDIVVKDIVLLESGDKVPADGIVIEGFVNIDESALNGETKEIKKTPGLNNKVYRGSIVYNGSAKIEITEVGDNTIYGNISKELQEKTSDSPLKIKLRGLAKIISRIGYIGAILASLSYLFVEIVVNNQYNIDLILNTLTNFYEMADYLIYALTLSVTIIVVAVPEGLPMMITLVLSSNMKRMLKDNILVRKLVGIETSGCMNVLLTDKTGTITKGKLEVIDFVGYNKKNITNAKNLPKDVLINCKYNNECFISNGKIVGGNITDKAIAEFVKDESVQNIVISNKELFDSQKKYSSVQINNKIYIKGAAEVIIPKCSKYLDKEEKTLYSPKNIESEIKKYTMEGYRIIVLAKKEKGIYTYLGLLRIKDEIRKEAKSSLELIKNAGINTIMITGDSKQTASCIAKEVGLLQSDSDIILDSESFSKLTDEQIIEIYPKLKVIARSMPQDKSRLVSILKSKDLVVGMTGDGVNDAPALKKADVGFAMGSGTEVAKEASDIVILDDNILSITRSILYGRTIYKSIRKFIIYQLSVNTCALIISVVGTLIGIQNPITIIQMLWLNMIMDTFSGLAFSYEPPLLEYMNEAPQKKNNQIMNKYMYSQIIVDGAYASILCMLFLKLDFFKKFIRFDFENKYLMTAYFAMFIFIGIINAFNARTTRTNVFANIFKNRVFLLIFSLIITVQIYIIYFGGSLFRTYGLTFSELIFVIIVSLTMFPVDMIRKYLIKKYHPSAGV